MLFEPGLNAHCSEFYYMNMANIFALSIYGNLNTTLSVSNVWSKLCHGAITIVSWFVDVELQ